MTVRRLQDNGDISTSGTQFIADIEEVAQTVRTNLKLFLGEYFRDITIGTPWFQQILGKGQELQVREAAIKRQIIQTRGVSSISSFNTDFDLALRKYSVNAGIITPFGETTISIADVI
jgi:hypothetical protein